MLVYQKKGTSPLDVILPPPNVLATIEKENEELVQKASKYEY